MHIAELVGGICGFDYLKPEKFKTRILLCYFSRSNVREKDYIPALILMEKE